MRSARQFTRRLSTLVLAALVMASCSPSPVERDAAPVCTAPLTACGGGCADTTTDPSNCGGCGDACGPNFDCHAGACVWHGTNIEHVVLIVEENHTFDSYFGHYCTAPTHSDPQCNAGPSCCEAAPDADPNGVTPQSLDDSFNYNKDHDHGYACEQCEINGGRMDRFTAGGCASDFGTLAGFETYGCSSPNNFAVVTDSSIIQTYWNLADRFALADRYYQSIVGSTSSNDMYFAVTHYEFADNSVEPMARGVGCVLGPADDASTHMSLSGRTTIADVLRDGGFTFAAYADGYSDAYNAAPNCPPTGGICHESVLTDACKYDPSDIPFEYYPQFTDNVTYMKDIADYFSAVSNGTLPNFAYVKFRTSSNEHPGWSWITDGESNVMGVVNAILDSSRYATNTLILLTWDEGGGYYDHVAPPTGIETYGPSTGAGFAGTLVPYGTRVPFLALGVFAKTGFVSHVQMEHSSIVAFLEWNFLGPRFVGAIHATDSNARDVAVNGIGSMLDAHAVGAAAP